MSEALKTVASIRDLNRLAINTGAVAQIGGRTINAGGTKMALKTPPEPADPTPPTPLPPPQPAIPPAGMSEADVRRLLDERDAEWGRRIDTMFTALMRSGDAKPPPTWDFTVEYGPKREITGIRAVPA